MKAILMLCHLSRKQSYALSESWNKKSIDYPVWDEHHVVTTAYESPKFYL